jgi:hypothetical protein
MTIKKNLLAENKKGSYRLPFLFWISFRLPDNPFFREGLFTI